MKKFALVLVIILSLTMIASCSGKKTETPSTNNDSGAAYTAALDALTTVWSSYDDADKFPAGGGDSENLSMEGPAKFDIAKTEELDVTLALPTTQTANVEDAASLMHMMNANTFTGAAYLIKDGTDMTAFANDVKETLNNRQWMCGFPEKFVVISSGNCVITAFGNGEIIETFKTKTTNALEGATVVMEDVIAA